MKKEFSGSGVLQDSIYMLARASTVTEAASILDNISAAPTLNAYPRFSICKVEEKILWPITSFLEESAVLMTLLQTQLK